MMRPITQTFLVLLVFGTAFGGRARAHTGTGVAVDPERRVIYFTDAMRSCVWRVDAAGEAKCFASGKHGNNLALDAAGNLYVQNFNATMWKISPDGKATRLLPESGGRVGSLDEFLTADRAGNLYFVSGNDFRGRQAQVLKSTPDGRVSVLAGGSAGHADGVGPEARFTSITSAAWGPDGALYVTDAHSVRRIAPDGAVATVAGGPEPGYADGHGASAKFAGLLGLAVDARGNVYVADRGNQCVRKITPQGEVSTLMRSSDIWTPAGVAAAGNDVHVDIYVLERKFLEVPQDLQIRFDSPRLVRISSGGKRGEFTVLATVPGTPVASMAGAALAAVAVAVFAWRLRRRASKRRPPGSAGTK